MDMVEFIKYKAYATVTNRLDKYVFLKEDENGRYIEYAFIDGAPHDNRCLSWYDKLQPKALERNHHKQSEWKLREVGELYELSEFCCGHQDKEGDEHCSAGHPCKKCVEDFAKHWTYDETVKCACWYLHKLGPANLIDIPLGLAQEYGREYDRILSNL